MQSMHAESNLSKTTACCFRRPSQAFTSRKVGSGRKRVPEPEDQQT